MMDIDLIKTPAFTCSIISNILSTMGFYVPFAFLPNSAAHYGIDDISIPWLISIIGCSSSLGRPFFGWMAVTFYRQKIVLYSFVLTGCGLSILMMQVWRKFYLLAIACALFGITSGNYVVIYLVYYVNVLRYKVNVRQCVVCVVFVKLKYFQVRIP